MDNKKRTVFQNLTRVLGPEGINSIKPSVNNYNIDGKTLIKTQNKEEYELAKTQNLQQKYLSNLGMRVDGESMQQALHMETTRIGSYTDFESMEYYPEIAAALDIYMEEATVPNDKGKILNIFSESKRVKDVLDDLFYNRLDIHTNLPMWTRSTCKLGDNFVYLQLDQNKGITGCRQLPNYEIQRVEGDLFSNITMQRETTVDPGSEKNRVRFHWRGKDINFESWQVAHFRLLGDDRKIPYGTCLKSDSYIETRDGYKQIKDINIDDEVYSFDLKTQKKVVSKVLDTVNSGFKTCYKLSTKHNYIDVSKEHNILYYNNETKSFEYKNTLDFKLGDLLVINKEKLDGEKIKIDKSEPDDYIKSQNYCEKNRYWNNVNEIIPENVTTELAELFGFLIGDGGFDKNTLYFALGIEEYINDKFISYLEKFTGRQGVKKNRLDCKGNVIYDKYVINSKLLITILKRLGFSGNSHTKRIPEWVFRSEKDVKEAFLNGLYLADGSIYVDKWNCSRYTFELANENLVKDVKILIQSLGYKSGKIGCRDRTNNELYIDGRKIHTISKSYVLNYYISKNKQAKKYEISNRETDNYILEPIISIEDIGEFETHDIYVENENHNFYANNVVVHNSILEKARRIWKCCLLAEDAMLTYRVTRAPERRIFKIFVGNIDDKDVQPYINEIANRFKRRPVIDPGTGQVDVRYNMNSNDADYFIPVRDEGAASPIETLPGASNLNDIADLQFLQNKLVTALRVPKTFLGFAEAVGDGKNLALLDIRFSRSVNRVQQTMLMELNKIAIIHLYLLGFEDDLDNFVLTLNNPSTQADMLKVQYLQSKVTLFVDATREGSNGFSPMSMTRAKKDIFNWSSEEIKQDLLEQRLEKAAGVELQNTNKIITKTGLFDDVDKLFGDANPDLTNNVDNEPTKNNDFGGGSSGGGGSFDMGGSEDMSIPELENSDEETNTDETNTEETDTVDMGQSDLNASTEENTQAESLIKKNNLLLEKKELLERKHNQKIKKYNNIYMDKLINYVRPTENPTDNIAKIYDKNLMVNESINQIINNIDNLIGEDKNDN